MELEVRDLGFGYTLDAPLFENLNFKLDSRSNLSVIGGSGVGKSSLLRVMTGILPMGGNQHFKGSVLLDGKDVHRDALKLDMYRSQGAIGFMFQTAELLPHMNIRDNIGLPQEITTGKVDSAHVNRLAELTGLTKHLKKYPRELSGGMRTRTALARTFSTRPSILLLDEPFSALDIAWKARLYQDTNLLCDEYGSHVVIVTHDLIEALLLSPRVIALLSNGTSTMHEVQGWKKGLPHAEAAKRYAVDYAAVAKILTDGPTDH